MIHQGNVLKGILRERGIPQSDFAEKLGVARTTFNYTLQRTVLPDELIEKAAAELNVDLASILSKEPEEIEPEVTPILYLKNMQQLVDVQSELIGAQRVIIDLQQRLHQCELAQARTANS